ncbi:MAG: NAD(P)-binding domain-containing protein [Pseudomonadota bacterium]
MDTTTTVIVGAGHAGLSMSRALTERNIDHIVLDRGRPGNAWITERWDSLQMLTPNWANKLPGTSWAKSDPHGFMSGKAFGQSLSAYALDIAAPLKTHVAVKSLSLDPSGFRVDTDKGPIRAETVVNATGATSLSKVPALAGLVPKHITQLTTKSYRNPRDVPDGTVLIVGASASGAQLARELQNAGRQVTLAAGSHVRLPRHYRGKDIEYWLEATGIYDEPFQNIDDLPKARRLPSAQLSGTGQVDLNALQALGVDVVGRLADIRDGKALFSGGLLSVVSAADLKMERTLNRIDDWIAAHPDVAGDAPVDRPAATRIPRSPRLSVDLEGREVTSVVWATGYAPDHSWMNVPVLDRRGRLQHDGGVCPVPGLFMLGLPILRRRRSHHVSGAASDSQDIAHILHQHLDARRAA